MKDIHRKVEEDLLTGEIIKYTKAEAQAKLGDRLTISSLGATPKDRVSDKVRILHDGTNKVGINNRIKVRDRHRFPLLDDLEALGRVARSAQVARFVLLYDVAKAHRQIPIVSTDWGLQAFQLDGPDPKPVYVHTVGTFGITSAAYWWSKYAAGAVRAAHYLCGEACALHHLLYADDGMALGRHFDKSLIMALFIICVLEVPITRHKVRGGLQVEWIGYQFDLTAFTVGISIKMFEWMEGWVRRHVAQGLVQAREFKAALGRCSFVCGALTHTSVSRTNVRLGCGCPC
jgi:hypothetical protein